MLLGDQALESGSDSDQAGWAEAFPYVGSSSGTATSITVYVDSGNQARTLDAGLYDDNNGNPGTMLASGSLSAPASGAWNTVTISSTQVHSGTTYWISVLGLGGTMYFRDRDGNVCQSESSSRANLSALPSTWQPGQKWSSCPMSAYVGGTLAPAAAAPPAPTSTGSPVVSGSPVQGQTLSTSNGSWSGAPTGYSYAWEDCDKSGAGCTAISGATSNTYTLANGDVGHTVRAVVTASNSSGSASASSSPTAVIAAAAAPASSSSAPSNTAEPVISGTVAAGSVLSTTNGTWAGSPTSYSYQWQDCASDGTSCSNISGATSSRYTVQAADAGHTIEAIVTATNASGSARTGAPIVPLIDEFSSSSVDTNIWGVLNQQGDTSNNEVECYLPSQTTEGGGALTESLVYSSSSFTCAAGTPNSTNPLQWKSGAVQMKSVNFTYGTIKVSAELAGQVNHAWPAIWLLGASCQTSSTSPFTFLSGISSSATGYYCPWSSDASDAAEIDIAEGNSGNDTSYTMTEWNGGSVQHCTSGTISDYTSHFHTYELDWAPGSLTWKLDGTTECTSKTSVPSHPMFLIVNTAESGSFNSGGGNTVVDYVHVSH